MGHADDDLDEGDELAELQRSNYERLVALGTKGVQVAPASLADLRILVYLGVLLDDRLPAAELAFERALAEQLTASEAQADQMAAAMRAQTLTAGILPS